MWWQRAWPGVWGWGDSNTGQGGDTGWQFWKSFHKMPLVFLKGHWRSRNLGHYSLRNGGSERWVSSAVSALVMERQSRLGPGFLVRCCFYYGSRSQAGSNMLVLTCWSLRSLPLTLSLPLCPLRAEITCRVIQICPWPLAVEASPHSWQWSSLHCLGL